MRFLFNYTAEHATTIKRLLAKHGVSHRLLKKLLTQNGVLLGEQTITKNLEISAGTVVTITLPPESGVAVSHQPIEIAAELDNWLVVVKPAGLSSVPGAANPDDSLLNRIAGYLADQGYDSPTPAIMTRLDRDTTGLVLAAKHTFAQGRLDAAGADAMLDKYYLAVVSGQMDAQGTIDLPLGLAADGIHREVRDDGQQARTEYTRLQQGSRNALLRVHLLTGRTHQIRAHFAHLGHPVVGDELYGGDCSDYNTQLLQASELSFIDPFTDSGISLQLSMPDAWQQALN